MTDELRPAGYTDMEVERLMEFVDRVVQAEFSRGIEESGQARAALKAALRDALHAAAHRATPAAEPDASPPVDVRMAEADTNGRCYCCNWPLAESVDKGCVIGNCAYRPDENHTDYAVWLARSHEAQEYHDARRTAARPSASTAQPEPGVAPLRMEEK